MNLDSQNVHRNPIKRALLFWTGWLFIALGFIGLFLPVIPTTPFVLVAVACFSRSSIRFYTWVMKHPQLGPPVQAWQQEGAISRQTKIVAVFSFWTGLGFSLYWVELPNLAKWAAGVTGMLVTLFLVTRPEPKR